MPELDAVVFPGQGSQKPGMGQAWVDSPSWALVGAASDVLGRDVAALLLEADAPTLQQTRNAQVAAFVLGLVVMDAARASGLGWTAAAGHSLGEYTALVAAGTLTVETAVRLVGERAESMQEAADRSPGTMAAVIGLDAAAVAACCDVAGGGVWMANDNAPGQIVVAGTAEAVAAAAAEAKAKGGRALPLAVGGAFHTPLMASAQPRLDAALGAAEFHDGRVPVVANVDADAHSAGADWADLLSRQLCSPVRWRDSVERLRDLGVTRVVELGPGAVLGGMVKRIAPDLAVGAIASPADLA